MLQQYKITTAMGRVSHGSDTLDFLSEEEKEEFDTIGYSGKDNKGQPCLRQEYLNRLNKGEFIVKQIKSDNGDFCEAFEIARYIKTEFDVHSTIKEVAQKLANAAHMPYCWEDVYNRLIEGRSLPFNFKKSK